MQTFGNKATLDVATLQCTRQDGYKVSSDGKSCVEKNVEQNLDKNGCDSGKIKIEEECVEASKERFKFHDIGVYISDIRLAELIHKLFRP